MFETEIELLRKIRKTMIESSRDETLPVAIRVDLGQNAQTINDVINWLRRYRLTLEHRRALNNALDEFEYEDV